jgi:bacterioferritin-associated ferredoxin
MLEILILAALGGWLVLALRSCRRRGGCGGDCGRCDRCDRRR